MATRLRFVAGVVVRSSRWMHDPSVRRLPFRGVPGGRVGRGDLAGAAHLELVSGVLQLRPEDAMFEAMLRGWKAQQASRGLREFTNEYPWSWGPSHVDEWTQALTSERRLAPSTIRGYQMDLRLFSEYLCDGRYGWAAACEKEFGPGSHPVPVCHEWNTIAHLYGYEGNPEARPFTREELQRFLDSADDQVGRAVRVKRKGALAAYRDATLFKVVYGWGLFSWARLLPWRFSFSRLCSSEAVK